MHHRWFVFQLTQLFLKPVHLKKLSSCVHDCHHCCSTMTKNCSVLMASAAIIHHSVQRREEATTSAFLLLVTCCHIMTYLLHFWSSFRRSRRKRRSALIQALAGQGGMLKFQDSTKDLRALHCHMLKWPSWNTTKAGCRITCCSILSACCTVYS